MGKFWEVVDNHAGLIALCFILLVIASCDVTVHEINKQDCTEVSDER